MAPNFISIHNINPENDETMKIKARVIRMWYTKPSKYSNDISSIELVLLDEQVLFTTKSIFT